MSALLGCFRCGFVTRRNSHIGKAGRCPDCCGALREMSLSDARATLRMRRLRRTAAA